MPDDPDESLLDEEGWAGAGAGSGAGSGARSRVGSGSGARSLEDESPAPLMSFEPFEPSAPFEPFVDEEDLRDMALRRRGARSGFTSAESSDFVSGRSATFSVAAELVDFELELELELVLRRRVLVVERVGFFSSSESSESDWLVDVRRPLVQSPVK